MDEGGEVLCYSSVTLLCACSCCIIYERLVTLFFTLYRTLDFFFLSLSLPLSYRVADTVARSLSGRGDTFGKVKGR